MHSTGLCGPWLLMAGPVAADLREETSQWVLAGNALFRASLAIQTHLVSCPFFWDPLPIKSLTTK